jgi:hypothetical protein
MAFSNISELKTARINSVQYFIDANVWIYSLQGFDDLQRWQQRYFDFFYDIVESKRIPEPKIILTSLLLSEIINTYLKQIAIPDYKLLMGIPFSQEFKFKTDYRPTAHYEESFARIMDDIFSFRSSILFIDDKDIANENTLLKNNIGIFDYNDYLYYCLCKELNKKHKVIIVTNDGDFKVNDIEIITSNRELLALK